jgi:hypothetical protein
LTFSRAGETCQSTSRGGFCWRSGPWGGVRCCRFRNRDSLAPPPPKPETRPHQGHAPS